MKKTEHWTAKQYAEAYKALGIDPRKTYSSKVGRELKKVQRVAVEQWLQEHFGIKDSDLDYQQRKALRGF